MGSRPAYEQGLEGNLTICYPMSFATESSQTESSNRYVRAAGCITSEVWPQLCPAFYLLEDAELAIAQSALYMAYSDMS